MKHYVDLHVKYASASQSAAYSTLLPPNMLIWLEDQIGARDKMWGWTIQKEKFWFVTEEDRLLFIMRWL